MFGGMEVKTDTAGGGSGDVPVSSFSFIQQQPSADGVDASADAACGGDSSSFSFMNDSAAAAVAAADTAETGGAASTTSSSGFDFLSAGVPDTGAQEPPASSFAFIGSSSAEVGKHLPMICHDTTQWPSASVLCAHVCMIFTEWYC